jgi:hypothetical protein
MATQPPATKMIGNLSIHSGRSMINDSGLVLDAIHLDRILGICWMLVIFSIRLLRIHHNNNISVSQIKVVGNVAQLDRVTDKDIGINIAR